MKIKFHLNFQKFILKKNYRKNEKIIKLFNN